MELEERKKAALDNLDKIAKGYCTKNNDNDCDGNGINTDDESEDASIENETNDEGKWNYQPSGLSDLHNYFNNKFEETKKKLSNKHAKHFQQWHPPVPNK